MNINTATKILKRHNRWRRGDDGLRMEDPKELGIAIETILSKLKNIGDICDVSGNTCKECKEPLQKQFRFCSMTCKDRYYR